MARKGSVGPAAWRLLTERVRDRDQHRCVSCSARRPLQVHHVIPRSAGGPDHESNLVSLCAPCHGRMDGGHWKDYVDRFLAHVMKASPPPGTLDKGGVRGWHPGDEGAGGLRG